MKKILLATTVLVGTAGFAAAEVALTGDARMGVTKTEGASAEFTSRARVTFTASGETDGGLAFGASFRADNAGDAAKGTAGSVFISGAFGKLTMGDVDSAFGATFGNIAGVGLTGLGDLNELSHSADGGAFGKIPSIYTTGVLTSTGYDSLFTLNAAKDGYVGKASDVTAFGANAALVWGSAFDAAAFKKSVDEQDGNTTALTDAELNRAITAGVAGPASLTEGEFDAALESALQGAVDKAALSSKLIASDTASADFSPSTYFGVGFANKAAAIATAEQAKNSYVDLSIDSSAVKGIPAKVLYEYSMDQISVAASYSQTGKAEAYSIAGAYTINDLKLSMGYANAQWDDAIVATITGFGTLAADPLKTAKFTITNTHDLEATDLNFGASYTMDSLTVALVAQRKNFELNGVEVDQIDSKGLSVGYSADGMGVSAFLMSSDSTASGKKDVYGVGASYALGGGATINAGLVGGDTPTAVDAGVSFKF